MSYYLIAPKIKVHSQYFHLLVSHYDQFSPLVLCIMLFVAEQFDVDYLEGISSEASADPNQLSRKSLFVKFDPLVGSSAPSKSAMSARLAEM